MNLTILGSSSEFVLTWVITNSCNYRCPYCRDVKSNDFTKNYSQRITEINNTPFERVIITGGECTLHPNIRDIIYSIHHPIRIWSNLSADIDIYLFKDSNVDEIYTSFHPDFTNFDEWFNKIKILSSYYKITANVMHSNNEVLNLSDSQIKMLNSCSKVYRRKIYGIKDYYKIEPESSLFENELLCHINNKPFYSINRKDLMFRTKAVKCDINKKKLTLYLDKYYSACVYNYYTIKEALDRDILCTDHICTQMFLRRGSKKGVFEAYNSNIIL